MKLLILVITSLVVFTAGLSSQGLTIDEPETIEVSRAISRFGVPSAWDGTNLQQVSGPQAYKIIGEAYVWKWHPWVQHYLAWIGEGTRFPFAICGVTAVVLFYFISKYYFKKEYISVLLSLQLLFSLPFFLYFRQIRYYAPTALLNLVVFYLLIVPRSWILMFLAGLLLFMSNYQSWFSTGVIVLPYLIFNRRWREVVAWFGLIGIAIGWYTYFNVYGGNLLIASAHPFQILSNFLKYISYTNAYYLPLILIPLVWFTRRGTTKQLFVLAVGWIMVKLGLLTVFFTPHGRYLAELAPILILVVGYIYLRFPKLAYVLWGLLVMTNILSLKSNWKYYPPMLATELTGNYPTMAPQIASYLKRQAAPGDLFWANNDQSSIYLYSGLPHVSNVCVNDVLQGPPGVTDPNRVRWLIFFQHDGRLYQDITRVPCMKDINLADYSKRIFPFSNPTFAYNDVDIVNRRYPPQEIVEDEVVIYERNPR